MQEKASSCVEWCNRQSERRHGVLRRTEADIARGFCRRFHPSGRVVGLSFGYQCVR
jgi:hypothetical protein